MGEELQIAMAVGAGRAAGSAASPQVRVCDICGAAGFDECLAICSQCNQRAEHVYCMQTLCDAVPPNWICEGCKKKRYEGNVNAEQEVQTGSDSCTSSEDIRTTFPCRGTSVGTRVGQHEQCVSRQGGGDSKTATPSGGVLMVSSCPPIAPGGELPTNTPNAVTAKAPFSTVSCRAVPAQNELDSKGSYQSLQDVPSSKLASYANCGPSKSRSLKAGDELLSFLLPSRPKNLLRSNSATARLSTKSFLKSRPAPAGSENFQQQGFARFSCRNSSQKFSGEAAVEVSSKSDKISKASEVSHVIAHRGNRCNNFTEKCRDLNQKEVHKETQALRKGELKVDETASRGKAAFSGSKQSAVEPNGKQGIGSLEGPPELRESSRWVNANTSIQLSKPFEFGILEKPKFLAQAPQGGQLNFIPLGVPVHSVSPIPLPLGGTCSLDPGNGRLWQPGAFHLSQATPWWPQGHGGMVYNLQHTRGICTPPTPSRSADYFPASKLWHGDYFPPKRQAFPDVQILWSGCFNVSSSTSCSAFYSGMQAHPSNRADPKVYKATQSLPAQLKLEELKRGVHDDAWPQSFRECPPTSNIIGLFFFPMDMESHDSWYKPLLDHLIAHDLTLRAELDLVHLLIFTSQLLPETEQLWNDRHYLWGIFITKKSTLTQTAPMLESAPVDNGSSTSLISNSEVVDMDIDMVGGEDVGLSTTMNRRFGEEDVGLSTTMNREVGGEDVGLSTTMNRESLEPVIEFIHTNLALPPLPPGSPPAQPSPPPTPPRSQQDDPVSLLPALPPAQPSSPPTPPQDDTLSFSKVLSVVLKHKSPVQGGTCSKNTLLQSPRLGGKKRPRPVPQSEDEITVTKKVPIKGSQGDIFKILLDAAKPIGLDKCASPTKRCNQKGESQILFSASPDGQPHQDTGNCLEQALQDVVPPVIKESTQAVVQTSGETFCDIGLKEGSEPLFPKARCSPEVKNLIQDSASPDHQVHQDNGNCLEQALQDAETLVSMGSIEVALQTSDHTFCNINLMEWSEPLHPTTRRSQKVENKILEGASPDGQLHEDNGNCLEQALQNDVIPVIKGSIKSVVQTPDETFCDVTLKEPYESLHPTASCNQEVENQTLDNIYPDGQLHEDNGNCLEQALQDDGMPVTEGSTQVIVQIFDETFHDVSLLKERSEPLHLTASCSLEWKNKILDSASPGGQLHDDNGNCLEQALQNDVIPVIKGSIKSIVQTPDETFCDVTLKESYESLHPTASCNQEVENQTLENIYPDGQLHEDNGNCLERALQDDGMPVTKGSSQAIVQIFDETFHDVSLKEQSEPLHLTTSCSLEWKNKILDSASPGGQLHEDNSNCLERALQDDVTLVIKGSTQAVVQTLDETFCGTILSDPLHPIAKLTSMECSRPPRMDLNGMNDSSSEIKAEIGSKYQSEVPSSWSSNSGGSSCSSPPCSFSVMKSAHKMRKGDRGHVPFTSSVEGQVCRSSKDLGCNVWSSSVLNRMCGIQETSEKSAILGSSDPENENVSKGCCCDLDIVGALGDINDSMCVQPVACLPLFPTEESSSVIDTTGILVDLVNQDGLLSDLSWQVMPLVQQLERPWYRPYSKIDGPTCLSRDSVTGPSDTEPELTLLFPQYRKHGNIWIKIDGDSKPCSDENVKLSLSLL